MSHQNEHIDAVVTAFIVNRGRVLLVHHKKIGQWLGVGGHWEPDRNETFDTALHREIVEETGLQPIQYEIVNQLPYQARCERWAKFGVSNHNAVQQFVPWAVEVHDFPPMAGHRHLALVYLVSAKTDKVKLEASAHNDIRWFTMADLEDTQMLDTIRDYGCQALKHLPYPK